MAHRKDTTMVGQVASLIDAERLDREAREVGLVKRQRKLDVPALVWSLALGFNGGRKRTLAGLRLAYQASTGISVAWSSFSGWFRPALVELLRRLVADLLTRMTQGVHQRVDGLLMRFRDLVAMDSVVVRLHESLENKYKACRTNHTKAAAKLHVVLSVLGTSSSTVRITSERVNDRTPFTRIGQWVSGRLLLFDLGYYSYWLFDRIDRQGGWFVSRLKCNSNPRIVAINRLWRGASVPVVGERLQDVVGRLKRQELDVDVEVAVHRRTYLGKSRRVKRTFRVVGVRNEVDGEYHLYMTNVPRGTLSPEEVSAVYAMRWTIELLFRELSVRFRLKDQPSAKPEVVQALLYAAMLSLIAGRRIHRYLCSRVHQDVAARMGPERTASAYAQFALLLLPLVTRRDRVVLSSRWLEEILAPAAIDPHARRPLLAMRVDRGQQINYMRSAQRAALAA